MADGERGALIGHARTNALDAVARRMSEQDRLALVQGARAFTAAHQQAARGVTRWRISTAGGHDAGRS